MSEEAKRPDAGTGAPAEARYTRRRVLELGAAGAVAAAALQAGGLPAIARGARSPQRLTVAYPAIGTAWHPHLLATTNSEVIANTYVEMLLSTNEDFKFVPALAERFQVMEPGHRWRFTLRDGIRFSNGQRVTAEDVKFSLEDYMRQDSPHRLVYASWFDRVAIVNARTVDVFASGPSRVALPGIGFSSRVIPASAKDDAAFAQRPIGTGKYVFDEFVPNDRLVVTKNGRYWGRQKPFFDEITFRQIPTDGTRVAAIEAGEVDFITSVPVQSIGRLRSRGLTVRSIPGVRTMTVWFSGETQGPLRDPRVRRALNYAVDRAGINRALFAGTGAPAHGPIPTSIPLSSKSLPRYDFNPGRARQLLREAGHGNGFELEMVTVAGRFINDTAVAEVIAAQLGAVDVRVKLTALETSTFTPQALSGALARQYDLILFAWNNYYPDPDGGLLPFSAPGGLNYGSYRNAQAYSLIANGRRPHNTGSLRRIYDRVQQLIAYDDPAAMFILTLPLIYAHKGDLQGMTLFPDERINWPDIRRA